MKYFWQLIHFLSPHKRKRISINYVPSHLALSDKTILCVRWIHNLVSKKSLKLTNLKINTLIKEYSGE